MLDFEREISHGSIMSPVLTHEPDGRLWIFGMEEHPEEYPIFRGVVVAAVAKPINGLYDNLNFTRKFNLLTDRPVEHVSAKHLPRTGGGVLFTPVGGNRSHIEMPINFPRILLIDSIWQEAHATASASAEVTSIPGSHTVAVVTSRGVAEFSDGWEVVSVVEGFSSHSLNLYVLKGIAGSFAHEIAVTQRVVDSIFIQMFSFREEVEISERWSFSSGLQNNVSGIIAQDKFHGEMILWALSANHWFEGAASEQTSHWRTSPDDIMRFSAPVPTAARQAVFLDDGSGAAVSRLFIPVLRNQPITGNLPTGAAALMMRLRFGSIVV